MSDNTTMKQRILDLRVFCAKHQITMVDVVEEAGIESYRSVMNAINSALQYGTKSISANRMQLLEESAIKLSEKREQEQVAQ